MMNFSITNKSERLKNGKVVDVAIGYSAISNDNEVRVNGRFILSAEDYEDKSHDDLLKSAEDHYNERKKL